LLEKLVIAGQLDLTLIPQGTLAERIRAGGAGIPAFYVPAGVGTVVAEGKEVREFDGKPYLMERALRADVSLVKAWKADCHGNLVYRKTARNFNPAMATAADLTIAEVEELVEPGQLDPDEIVTPGIYVNRVVVGPVFKKPIESRFIEEYATMTEKDTVSPESPFTLTGKTAIVTGGGRGIGRAIVHRLVSAGANVLVCDLDQQALQETQASARNSERVALLCGDLMEPLFRSKS
jgi:acyl CoA:acetate/3-ketoacid CoA transferase